MDGGIPQPHPHRTAPRLAVLRGKQASCSPLPWGHIPVPHPKMRMCVHLFVCTSKLVCVYVYGSTCCRVIRYGQHRAIGYMYMLMYKYIYIYIYMMTIMGSDVFAYDYHHHAAIGASKYVYKI